MSLASFIERRTKNKDKDVKQTEVIVEQDVEQTVKHTDEINRVIEKEPEKTLVLKNEQFLTPEMVLDFIKSLSGKKTGYASLERLICRHKAVSISMLYAIIEIHRHFREYL